MPYANGNALHVSGACSPLIFRIGPAVRYYFDKWTNDGTWLQINDAIQQQIRTQAGRGPELTAAVVDSQRVKTTEAGGERGYDAGKSQGPQTPPLFDMHGLVL